MDNQLYKQLDGVAMGSPLGTTFADFYMGHVEAKTLGNNSVAPPKLYRRYVDDIFIIADNYQIIHDLKTSLEKNSVLEFTIELEKQHQINFLDLSLKSFTN